MSQKLSHAAQVVIHIGFIEVGIVKAGFDDRAIPGTTFRKLTDKPPD
jgi:hypothetical protein